MKNSTLGRIALIFSLVIFLFACDEDESPYWEGDITVKLKENLEAGNDITLPSGTFIVSESILVESYCGIVQGAADGTTIIEVSADFTALYDPSVGGSNTEIAEIFALTNVNCDVTFQNLTFNVKGAAPANSHNNPFLGITTTIDNVIVVSAGTEADITVTYKNLIINGEVSTDAGAVNGRNLAWPLIVTGVGGTSAKAIDCVIDNCTINNSGQYSIEYITISNSTGIITNNTISNSRGMAIGWGAADMSGTSVDIKDNQFSNIIGNVLDEAGTPAICFMDNTLDGTAMQDDCPQ